MILQADKVFDFDLIHDFSRDWAHLRLIKRLGSPADPTTSPLLRCRSHLLIATIYPNVVSVAFFRS